VLPNPPTALAIGRVGDVARVLDEYKTLVRNREDPRHALCEVCTHGRRIVGADEFASS
jgi:hypothetical protein